MTRWIRVFVVGVLALSAAAAGAHARQGVQVAGATERLGGHIASVG